ncbi:MAG: peptide deformylase [Desulfobulbaceae bacterium]|nr:peptide deformylase [Desulfobulbaceae bacterium]HIJ78484.1 peptide deformylase [Deltaproteobacteria bacterium]
MALREILTYPFPILKKAAEPVKEFGEELEQLVADMAETMYDAPGVGLAAPQIGIPLQLCVIDIMPKDQERELIVLANPKIIEGEGKEIDEEGCLSVLDYSANVPRFTKIKVEAQDIKGNPLNFEAEGFFARVIQHELDHLDGTLFIDRISSLKRTLYKKKVKKMLRAEKEEGEK